MTNRIAAVYPGTFDPVTLGHTDIIKRAHSIFGSLLIGVAHSIKKKPIFTIQERIAMLRNEVAEAGLSSVEVKEFNGLLVDFIQKEEVRVIVRGLRAVSDFEYEFQMAYCNSKLYTKAETIFITAGERSHFISSTWAKEVASLGGNLSNVVSPYVAGKLHSHFFGK